MNRRAIVTAGDSGIGKATAREIAHAIVYLTSPEASYTTGASFVIDGGMLLFAADGESDSDAVKRLFGPRAGHKKGHGGEGPRWLEEMGDYRTDPDDRT